MALEIERKYLVINDKWRDNVIKESAMRQGYLASQPNATVRVRVSGSEARLTIKGRSKGISRSEYEYSIPLQEAQELLDNHIAGALIEKVRYQVRCGNHIWDLDVFDGANRGLVIAEVELSSEDEGFLMPEWAGEEVSSDSRYYNASLVSHPYCDW
ncbi:MAG: adenylate cyclase [gamma proteobacterium symbiont of Ctena orbiculata]|uniref:CYTH domain-containing protein n=1 Tax=Candidatus Thiodiazotropha taylori TaxID=2792791 RepID=A0A944QU75_9GAMM|nr:CYTH domain-containing protein [Candidatus Thiodiazotropha taylori]PUB83877.1 MAG: adenylate cyclase [gamma proteobacterium symbiont of Ctena orbiculata]MBT2990768.1 CYTH domain-containing protein [Candidatus Thiodiazotropha taylori]MBT2997718.1 CYTH domain-containing protein [Candidatus Thiodiazotropha taylori]MBT3000513.1 CYTH domain-containing protein [Candidatus Thiodiazotropha taylori]